MVAENVSRTSSLSESDLATLHDIQKQKEELRVQMMSLKYREATAFLGKNAVLDNSSVSANHDTYEREEKANPPPPLNHAETLLQTLLLFAHPDLTHRCTPQDEWDYFGYQLGYCCA